jgi:hypothetical protein
LVLVRLQLSKRFFFEKKNQKTTSGCRGSFRRGPTQRMKVFCFFSSEKKTFLPYPSVDLVLCLTAG